MIRAVLDVNVIISAVLSAQGAPRRLLEAWQAGAFVVVVSQGIISEVTVKLLSPRIGGAYGVTSDDILYVSALLQSQGELVQVPQVDVPMVTGDLEDDYVLAAAADARADALITGDKRLLSLTEHEGVRIISPAQFVEELALGS